MFPMRRSLLGELFAFLLLMAALLSCGDNGTSNTPATPAPVAGFSFTPAAPLAGQSVTFSDASTGSPTAWSWSFGDGTASTLQSPSHIYAATGPYTVTLTATNAGGSTQATHIVTVQASHPAPAAAFTFVPTAPKAGASVTFADLSTGSPTSWTWDFGDGNTSHVANPVHAYGAANTYTVTLTVANDLGTDQATQTVVVVPASAATFTLTSGVAADGGVLPIEYTMDGSGASPDLAWSGAPTGTKGYALLLSTLPGDGTTRYNWVLYNIPATTTRMAKNAPVGTSGKSSDVVVAYAPPQSSGPGLKTYTFTLYALSGAPGLPADPSQVTGDVLAKAIAPLTLGSASTSVGYARQAPVSSFTSAANGFTVAFTSACGLSTSSWAWDFGDGGTSSEQSPAHTYAGDGTYTVKLVAGNAFGTNVATLSLTLGGSAAAPSADWFVAPALPSATAMAVFTDLSSGSPTQWAWQFGDGGTSTEQHPTHTFATAGTYSVTLQATNALGSTTKRYTITVGAAVPSTAKMNMAQTVSDQAQRTTLAFSGLAILTGNLEAQSFYPPGKVADYTGFQFLRDNDPSDMGHNTSFLTRVANNVISILTDAQLKQLGDLAVAQQAQFSLYGYKRFPLMKAFRQLVDGDLPAGKTALGLEAVKAASRDLYLIDGQISFDRARLYTEIYASLSASQKSYLDAMVGKGWSQWPDVPDSTVKERLKSLPGADAVAVMTYAGDIFSWYACGVEGDVYFCPERQGTYYGGFYIKDAPAIGHEGYSIDQQLTATAGEALSNASKGYVTTEQAQLMSSLVDTQRANLYGAGAASIVGVRTQISNLLRAMRTSTANAEVIKARVLALSALYGELDGINNHAYATVFANVWNRLSTDQKTKLMTLRKSILSGTYADGTPFDFTVCTTPFLYSAVIKDASVLTPYLSNTDGFFE